MNIKKTIFQPLLKHAFTTTIWSFFGKSIGFLIPFFIAAWFGVTKETDIFFYAYGFVLLLTGTFATSIESTIVPFIAEIRSEDKENLSSFLGDVLGAIFVAIVVVYAIILGLAKPILPIITRFPGEELPFLFTILVEIAPLMVLVALTSVLQGVLNAHKMFIIPALSPAFRAVLVIGTIFLMKPKLGIHSIPLGYVIGEMFRFVLLLWIIFRKRFFNLKISLKFTRKTIEFLKTAAFQSIYFAAGGIAVVIDKTMASWLSQGSVSILHYADRLYMIPANLLTIGLLPVVLSYWSREYYKHEDKKKLISTTVNAAKISIILSLPIFVILILLRKPIVYLAFARGQFPISDITTLEWTWVGYLAGLMPYVVAFILFQAYIVLKKTLILMKLGILNCILNIVLNYSLMKFMGVTGIALSSSLSVLVIAVLLTLFLPKDNKIYEN